MTSFGPNRPAPPPLEIVSMLIPPFPSTPGACPCTPIVAEILGRSVAAAR